MKFITAKNTVEYLEAQNLENQNIAHAFFTRKGGFSNGIYESLNGGLGSNDNKDHVLQNRARMAQVLDVEPTHFLTLHQIHSNIALKVEAPWHHSQNPQADAMVTTQKGIAIAVASADCTPVLFADTSASVIGAAHAGWKGAKAGILQSTIQAMEKCGASRKNISAAIGPHIRQQSYEVGQEFFDAFIQDNASYTRYFLDADRKNHFWFDLSGYVVHQLHQAGIENIEDCRLDTYSQNEYFFSHRRSVHNNEGDYGRLYSAIVLR